ncbi:hypothetical protein LOK49_LG04G03636 [Camellia lanceoleosa]|uniref:Uncharacterized protein n=1 Tax=Camellia lanceoleosa TaxID=1840588 RepID=A0ACC0HYE6_9ERIC|nr:hypothetical protein LOK49_LG04G03636 [Camellia lanceoleosa]
MSTAAINACCLTSLSQSSLIKNRPNNTTSPRLSAIARLTSSSSSSSSSSSPPSLIRNEPVFAAPQPIITPSWREDMGTESYEEAIAGLKKLLREKSELEPIAATKIDQITAELQTSVESKPSSPLIERMKNGFIHFKREKYE